jgi:protein-S-isoprenylcysteine O-methyltransferase Ste14
MYMSIFWLVLSVLLWGFAHSILASLKAKDLAHRAFASAADRFYRLAYNLFAGLSFIPVLALAALTPDRKLYSVPVPWAILMVFGELLAVVALMAGFRQTDALEFIGLRQLFSPTSSQPGKLVTSGLYRYVRHPLYTSGLVFIWLFPTMTVTLLTVFATLTAYIIIGATFEERKLRREYGQAYAVYQASTPMLVPFLRRNKK